MIELHFAAITRDAFFRREKGPFSLRFYAQARAAETCDFLWKKGKVNL